MNGVKIIKEIESDMPTGLDLCGALLVDLGCSISNMPREVEGNITYTERWEFFDPAKVSTPKNLPNHWAMVFEMHNRPDMKDCRDLKYRYIHAPTKILPRFPRVPCKGIFCITDKNIKLKDIKARDLIHIGNEFI